MGMQYHVISKVHVKSAKWPVRLELILNSVA